MFFVDCEITSNKVFFFILLVHDKKHKYLIYKLLLIYRRYTDDFFV